MYSIVIEDKLARRSEDNVDAPRLRDDPHGAAQ